MKIWLRRWLAGILGAGLALAWAGVARPAQAQAGLTLEALTIEVWPEFDRPSALVLFHGVLPATAGVPAQVSVRIPQAAQLNATAYEDASGALLAAQSTLAVEGEWQRVTFTVQALNFRLEYYDTGLVFDGQQRRLDFQWPAEYAAKAVSVRIQEPVDTQGLQVDPAFIPLGARDFGLNYYGREYGAVSAGASIAFTLTYTKTSAALSQATIAQPTAAVSVEPWLIGLGAVGGLAILGGAGWYLWSRSSSPKVARKPRSRPHRPSASGSPARDSAGTAAGTAAGTRFCTQCGQALKADDRFCRNCGSPLRD